MTPSPYCAVPDGNALPQGSNSGSVSTDSKEPEYRAISSSSSISRSPSDDWMSSRLTQVLTNSLRASTSRLLSDATRGQPPGVDSLQLAIEWLDEGNRAHPDQLLADLRQEGLLTLHLVERHLRREIVALIERGTPYRESLFQSRILAKFLEHVRCRREEHRNRGTPPDTPVGASRMTRIAPSIRRAAAPPSDLKQRLHLVHEKK